jgi:hypothetical protein
MSSSTRHTAAHSGGLAPHHPASDSLPASERRPRERGTAHDARVLFVAVVVAWDHVRFTASAPSRHQLLQHVARYVRRHVDDQLWPTDARDVRVLLEGGRLEAAVGRYFALVGARWDKEWLVMTDVDVADVDEGDALDAA